MYISISDLGLQALIVAAELQVAGHLIVFIDSRLKKVESWVSFFAGCFWIQKKQNYSIVFTEADEYETINVTFYWIQRLKSWFNVHKSQSLCTWKLSYQPSLAVCKEINWTFEDVLQCLRKNWQKKVAKGSLKFPSWWGWGYATPMQRLSGSGAIIADPLSTCQEILEPFFWPKMMFPSIPGTVLA